MYLSIPTNKPTSRKAMIAYLAGHPRCHTMNSWNCSTSYAHKIKIHCLGLDKDTLDTCFDMLDVSEAFEEFTDILRDFERRHDWRWQITQNGRSGGYIVLIHGGKSPDSRIYCHPGKPLDMNEDFETWDAETLHARVELVWDFDHTCEAAVAAFVEFAGAHTVEERDSCSENGESGCGERIGFEEGGLPREGVLIHPLRAKGRDVSELSPRALFRTKGTRGGNEDVCTNLRIESETVGDGCESAERNTLFLQDYLKTRSR